MGGGRSEKGGDAAPAGGGVLGIDAVAVDDDGMETGGAGSGRAPLGLRRDGAGAGDAMVVTERAGGEEGCRVREAT